MFCFYLEEISEDKMKGFKGEGERKELSLHTLSRYLTYLASLNPP